MSPLPARILHVPIDARFEPAYAFASKPENFPLWAMGLSRRLFRRGAEWIAETPEGEAVVEFSEPNRFGVLDHRVRLPGKPEIHIPLRMVANGNGVEVELMLFRQPDMDDDAFERDATLVLEDLHRLKALLEAAAVSAD